MEDGGRVEYGQGTGPAGVQPIANPKTDFDTVVRQMQDTTGLGLGDAVLEVITKEQEQYSVEFAPERIVELRAVIKEMVDAINS